jgi:hypothetical protein
MPRYVVTICDCLTKEIKSELITASNESSAICRHSWLTYTYTSMFISTHIFDEDAAICKANLIEALNWAAECVNLDTETMNALNAGDSNASSQTQQS